MAPLCLSHAADQIHAGECCYVCDSLHLVSCNLPSLHLTNKLVVSHENDLPIRSVACASGGTEPIWSPSVIEGPLDPLVSADTTSCHTDPQSMRQINIIPLALSPHSDWTIACWLEAPALSLFPCIICFAYSSSNSCTAHMLQAFLLFPIVILMTRLCSFNANTILYMYIL